eukprot:m51a1_g584 hypothetical protein (337) ;mRNA; r:6646-8200
MADSSKKPSSTLTDSIKSHLEWFEEKVEMIPAELYVAHEDMTPEEWRRKQRKRSATELAATKEAKRAAKRTRFDPEAPRKTVAELQQAKKDKSQADVAIPHAAKGQAEATTEVRKKKPIEELQRKVAELNERRKRGIASPSPSLSLEDGSDGEDAESGADDDDDDEDDDESGESEGEDGAGSSSDGRTQFSTFDYSTGKPVPSYLVKNRGNKKQKPSLRAQLDKAVRDKNRAKEDSSVQWDAALKRSTGEKVLDDPRLLKKKLKREETRRKKSAAKWEERNRQVAEAQRARQEARTQHLHDRSETRKDRKFGRKQKQQKKTHRPGFEGKKKSFINS